MTPEQREVRARTRFFILSLLRISGAVLMMLGVLVTSGRFTSVPPVAGYVLVAIGFLGFLLVPRALARRWRTPPDA